MSVLLYILSVNLDSIGVGLSYGVRKIHISRLALLIIALFSVICSFLALIFGRFLGGFLTIESGKALGDGVLFFLGLWILLSALKNDAPRQIKAHTFSVKPLGITVSIMQDPTLCDFDDSSRIDGREAVYLALALSLDSIAISIGVGISGFTQWYLPLLIGASQLVFLECGRYLGKKLANKFKISNKVWTFLAGLALIILALLG